MDYPAIDQFMKKTGLAVEPAFDYLHFMTERIPSEANRKILGLYYPDGDMSHDGYGYLPPSTIILPPDSSEGTLLHELGHRYGHFYYNDLSEPFAENYRMAMQKKLSPRFSGSYARTVIQNISQEKSLPTVAKLSVPAIGDWSVSGWEFRAPPATLKAGNTISVSLNATINDLLAGFPDQWQVAVAVGVVNPAGGFTATGSRVYKSSNFGMPVPYSTTINIFSLLDAFNLGQMPARDITLVAFLYANHDDRPAFTPFDYATLASNGWDWIGAPLTQNILLDTAPPPPPGGTGMQLYQQGSTPDAATYNGKAETAVFSFSTGPEQIDFVNSFFVNQMVAECENAIQQNSPGDRLLFFQLFRDTSSLLRTDYELHLTSTDITGNALPWALIIVAAIALIAYWLVVRPLLMQVTSLIWGPGTGSGGKPPSPLSNPLVLIAGGVGIVAVIAMLKGTSVKGAIAGRG